MQAQPPINASRYTYVAASLAAETARQRKAAEETKSRARLRSLLLGVATGAAILLFGLLMWSLKQGKDLAETTTALAASLTSEQDARAEADRQRQSAEEQSAKALYNESAALAAIAKSEQEKGLYTKAAKLALAAWPRRKDDERPALDVAWSLLRGIAASLHERLVFKGHDGPVWGAAFDRKERRILTWSGDKTARLWNISGFPEGNGFELICAWLPDHSLEGLAAEYGLNLPSKICEAPKSIPTLEEWRAAHPEWEKALQ